MQGQKWVTLLICLILLSNSIRDASACFAVVVGRLASKDGSVLLGHNEENDGDRILNFRKVPAMTFPKGTMIDLADDSQIPQAEKTNGFLWSQNPGMVSSDTYLNDHGVAVVSNFCPDRYEGSEEQKADIKNGKYQVGPDISYIIRRIMIERGNSARDAIKAAAGLISKYGYASSRTFVVADPKEAWLFSVTHYGQWVAQRVPDDKVVALPNQYIIGKVDLHDENNFMVSPGLVDFAVKRGWYDPKTGPFMFDKAYSQPRNKLLDPRQQAAQELITKTAIDPSPDLRLPMTVSPPKAKMGVKDVLAVLRDGRSEEIPMESFTKVIANMTTPANTCSNKAHGIPNETINTPLVQEAAVFQLRSAMPTAIGAVYWRVLAEPDVGVSLPWYVGISETPKSYYEAGALRKVLSEEDHFSASSHQFKPGLETAWGTFKKLQDLVNKDRTERLSVARSVFDKIEAGVLKEQASIDKRAAELYAADPIRARAYITEYCARKAAESITAARTLIERFEFENKNSK